MLSSTTSRYVDHNTSLHLTDYFQALLLSHPGPLTRDTQRLAGRHKVMKSKYPALRNLVQQELGVAIQGGEHSSVGIIDLPSSIASR
jgi:hypothetical protein